MKARHGLEIRAATGADASGLSELLGLAGYAISPGALTTRLEAMRQEAGVILIAAAWGPPSGLIVAHWYRVLERDQPTAQITSLLVGLEDRRRGIGRMLIKAAAQAARVAGCGTLEVLAAPDAHDLREFCRATGFIEAGSRFARGLRKKG